MLFIILIFQDLSLNTQIHDFMRLCIWWTSAVIYRFTFLFDTQNATWAYLLINHLSILGKLFLWICLSTKLFWVLPGIRSLFFIHRVTVKFYFKFIIMTRKSYFLTQRDIKQRQVSHSATPGYHSLTWFKMIFLKQKCQFWSHVLGYWRRLCVSTKFWISDKNL